MQTKLAGPQTKGSILMEAAVTEAGTGVGVLLGRLGSRGFRHRAVTGQAAAGAERTRLRGASGSPI